MTEANTTTSPAKQPLLARKPVRLALFAVGGLAAIALVMGVFKPDKKEEYRAEAVRTTTISRGVSASGEIEAVDSVTIGSEVSGQIREVLVDFNQEVKKGQLLAVIDTETFEARVRQAQAQQDAAAADARVAQSDYERQKRLAEGGLVAQKALEDAGAQRARASAQLRQAQASLSTALADLAKANIRSPIDGVIVNRTIEPGQTVAASMNAPELFVVAKDLERLQIKIMVDEADIGEVREGQLVRFTIDAFPDENFEGRVTQVRKQPEKTANVVTYVVIAEAPNPGRKLLPGMTANADIVMEERPNVMAVPASALRWRPEGAEGGGQRGGEGGGAGAGAGGGGFAMAGGAPGGGGRGAMGGFNGPIEQNPMFKNIKLDDTQKASIKKIQDGMRGKLMAVFQEAGGDRAKMRELMGKEREAMNEQIKAVLKPDQRTAFDANLTEMRAAMGEGGARRNQAGAQMQRRTLYKLVNNQPAEVPVLVGITDSTLTEIRPVEQGALKEGDMVITGKIGAATQQQQGGQGGPGRGGMMPFGGP